MKSINRFILPTILVFASFSAFAGEHLDTVMSIKEISSDKDAYTTEMSESGYEIRHYESNTDQAYEVKKAASELLNMKPTEENAKKADHLIILLTQLIAPVDYNEFISEGRSEEILKKVRQRINKSVRTRNNLIYNLIELSEVYKPLLTPSVFQEGLKTLALTAKYDYMTQNRRVAMLGYISLSDSPKDTQKLLAYIGKNDGTITFSGGYSLRGEGETTIQFNRGRVEGTNEEIYSVLLPVSVKVKGEYTWWSNYINPFTGEELSESKLKPLHIDFDYDMFTGTKQNISQKYNLAYSVLKKQVEEYQQKAMDADSELSQGLAMGDFGWFIFELVRSRSEECQNNRSYRCYISYRSKEFAEQALAKVNNGEELLPTKTIDNLDRILSTFNPDTLGNEVLDDSQELANGTTVILSKNTQTWALNLLERSRLGEKFDLDKIIGRAANDYYDYPCPKEGLVVQYECTERLIEPHQSWKASDRDYL